MKPDADLVLSLALQANLQLDPRFAIVVLRTIPGTPNAFDDWLCVLWRDGQAWQIRSWPCTSDPGLYWLHNPGRKDGTAILCPGQHRMVLGAHKGQYPCLAQTGFLPVWRDNDRDDALRYGGQIFWDSAGIQIHHAGNSSSQVDKWSAGCIVVASLKDWNSFWRFIQATNWMEFPVTLLENRI